MTFAASLRSELLKIKRTRFFYLILVAAFVVPFILVFDNGAPAPGDPADGWSNFYLEGTRVFVLVVLQLFFILGSTFIMQIEIRNNAWKQVLTSPQPLIRVLLSKFLIIHLLALTFIAVYNAYMILGAAVLDAMYDLHYLAYLERWPDILRLSLTAYGSVAAVSGLSFWLALRSDSSITPVALGLLLWIIGPIAAFEFKWPHMDKYMSVIPFIVMSSKFEHQSMLFYQLLSCSYGMAFFAIAYLEFTARRVRLRFEWRK